jgi:hypothetical protein
MAARKGVNITKLDDSPARKPQSSFFHGRVRVQSDKYDTADGFAAGDTVTLGRLPKGAVVLGGRLDWDSLTVGSAPNVVVGDSDDSDRFMGLTVLPSAASSATVRAAASVATYGGWGASCGFYNIFDDADDDTVNRTGIGYEYTCDKDIILTITNGNATAGFIRLTTFYSTE